MEIVKNAVAVMSLLSLILFSPLTLAEDDQQVGSGPNPFSDCGIGAALFPTTHWAAVTSNVIWDVGTTAVTSATASPETCNGKRAKVAYFINDMYDNVIEETAHGQGEHLVSMLEIYGCNTASHDEVVSAIRPQVAHMITSDGYAQRSRLDKAENYYQILTNRVDSDFAQACTS